MSTVNTTSIKELLKNVNRDPQPSIVGCQILCLEATRLYADTQEILERQSSKLSTLEEMTYQARQRLNRWQRTPNCSLHRGACRDGKCGCSYGDLVHLASLHVATRQLRKKVAELEHLAQCYRLVANRVIAAKFSQLLDNEYCVQAFIEMALIVGDITDDEDWLAKNCANSKLLEGSPYELRLVLGVEKPHVVRWNMYSERIS